MLDVRQLSSIQAFANKVLDQTCTIQHVSVARETYGGASESLSAPVTVACLVARPSANLMQQYAEKIGALQLWQITVPSGTDVRVNDVVVVNGQTLRVQAPYTPQSYSVLDSYLASEVR